MKKRKAKYFTTFWQIDDHNIPVKVFHEWRASRRVSIGKSSIIARFPIVGRPLVQDEHERWAKRWLAQQLRSKPTIFDHLTPTVYNDGTVITTSKKEYILFLQHTNRKTGKGTLAGGRLNLNIPNAMSLSDESKMIHSLIARLLASDNLAWVTSRVNQINEQFQIGVVKQVRLKNNKSNWGSCSSTGNINLSVKLLFAPEDVQDYVIVHELAHLRELNHTNRFWKIVAEIMPDYKQKERWLRKHSHLCDF